MYIPSTTPALLSAPGGQGSPDMPSSHVLVTGGFLLFGAVILSVAGYFFHKRKIKNSASSRAWTTVIKDFIAPHCREGVSPTSASPNTGPPRVSSPSLVSSTDPVYDPWFLSGGQPGHITVNTQELFTTHADTTALPAGEPEAMASTAGEMEAGTKVNSP